MFGVLAIVSGISNFAQVGFFSLSGERLTKRLRTITFQALIKQEVAFFDDEKNGTGILTSKLATDATKVQGLTGSLMGSILQNSVNLVLGLVSLFYLLYYLYIFIYKNK